MSDMRTRLGLEDGALIVQNTQQCTPIAEEATRLHNEGLHGSSDMKHAALIPNVFIEDYCARNGITYEEWCRNKEHVRRVLNDPALSAFRIWKGRV